MFAKEKAISAVVKCTDKFTKRLNGGSVQPAERPRACRSGNHHAQIQAAG
jgi:hypothetical protein